MSHTHLILSAAFIVYLYAGISAFQLDPGRKTNLLFSSACAVYCLWALSYAAANTAMTGASAPAVYRTISFGSVFFISLMLHFTHLLTAGRKLFTAPFFMGAFYLPSIIFLCLGVLGAPGAEDFNMLSIHPQKTARGASFLFRAYSAWYGAGLSACLLMVFSWKSGPITDEEAAQARVMIRAGALSLLLALTANLILLILNLKMPVILLATTLVWIFGALQVLAKQRVISLGDANVSQNILKAIAEAVILTDAGGRVVSANPAATELSGYCSSELVRLHITRLLKKKGSPVKEIIRRIRGGETVKNISLALESKHGPHVPVIAHASPITGRDNTVEGISFILNDITEAKKTETLLRRNEEKYRDLWENAPAAYHILDASGKITDVNLTECRLLGYAREEMLGREIFDFILSAQRENSKKRFFEKITGQPVPAVQKRCYLRKDGSEVFVSVHDAPQRGGQGQITGIRTTMLDITQRVRAEQQLEQSLEQMILVIAKIVELRDPYTAGHGRKVSELACSIAKEMGYSQDRINGIHMAAIIHDIGKIYVPVEILSKPSTLSDIEFDIIKEHASAAHEILKGIDFPWPIADIIHQHHERIDGSGYPLGITGAGMLAEAKIISIADVTESMISFRPYRPGLGIETAMEEIRANSGILYDAGIAGVCRELFSDKGFMFNEENNGNGTYAE